MTILKKGTKHTLSAEKQKLAKENAAARTANNRKNGVINRKAGEIQTQDETELEGVASEIAFGEMTGGEVDLSIGVRSNREKSDRGDVTLPDGRRVDVKSSWHSEAHLIVDLDANPTVDLYAQMTGAFPTYTFVGVMTPKELMTPDHITDRWTPGTKKYVAGQEELKDLEEK